MVRQRRGGAGQWRLQECVVPMGGGGGEMPPFTFKWRRTDVDEHIGFGFVLFLAGTGTVSFARANVTERLYFSFSFSVGLQEKKRKDTGVFLLGCEAHVFFFSPFRYRDRRQHVPVEHVTMDPLVFANRKRRIEHSMLNCAAQVKQLKQISL